MIEARIVEARTNFTRDLGVSWNFQYTGDNVDDVSDLASAGISGGGSFVITPAVGAAGLGSSFTFGQLGISSSVLDLRLSAAETAGNSKVISKPRVTTLNGETAVISQGTQIPYQSISDQGTKTEFVDATLELNVTPIINPDESIILEIKASNNTPTTVSGASAPGIDKKEATTKVLVRNGETTVIGGIFTESDSKSETGIPWLRKLPIIGYLFKSTNKSNDRSELLIFITPRILE
jgi:type IV pilus assembly protein PilQ